MASPVWGAIDAYEFDNEVDRKRYVSFIEEMRCPKCQNQNLSGSDSPIAADLRRELYFLIQDGRSEDRKSTRLNSSHVAISYAVFCLKKKNNQSSIHTVLFTIIHH